MDEDPSTILLVEEADGEIIGFVSATRGTRPLRSILMRHPVRVSLALLPSCVVPWRLAGMLAVARYERRGGPPIAGLPRAELLSIAVAESHRGKGVAERLFRRLEDAFRADGIREFRIVVGAGLVPASRFYIRMGAREAGRFRLHDGEDSLVYVRTISA
jgi:ribosomal protein S18 acetylase RimI-like enzyme